MTTLQPIARLSCAAAAVCATWLVTSGVIALSEPHQAQLVALQQSQQDAPDASRFAALDPALTTKAR
jgi:hypothetical protein